MAKAMAMKTKAKKATKGGKKPKDKGDFRAKKG